jgi:uncharacterized protein (TIGR01244 family)
MFIAVTDRFSVAGQLQPSALAQAKAKGFVAIINNRPDAEEPGQPANASIAAEAATLGLAYVEIPVGRAGFNETMISATNQALAAADGPVLAFCRSGTRSITLWAFARAAAGEDPDGLIGKAAIAGYDLAPMAGTLQALAGQKD